MSVYSFGFEHDEVVRFYAKYRPAYPVEVYDKIMKYLNEGPFGTSTGPRVAVDVGCGSGQHTRALEKYFDTVIGVDSSEAQINEAKRLIEAEPKSKIDYHIGTAEDLSSVVGEGVADLVTAATALHWFDLERFYSECVRVLKIGGVFAAISYDFPTWRNAKADQLTQELMSKTFDEYWPFGAYPVFDTIYPERFSKMPLYFEECIIDNSVDVQFGQSVSEFLGLIKSFPVYHLYKSVHPEHPDEVDRITEKLMNIYETSSIDEKVDSPSSCVWLLLGRSWAKPPRQ